MSDPIEQFRAAMLAAGLTPPDDIHADGQLHRFSSNGKPRDDSGWYVLHLDGVPAGSFGCWREGFSQNWCAKSADTFTPAEREAHRQRMEAARALRDAEQAERQQQAATEAERRWAAASPATAHPYLAHKAVGAHGTRIELGGLLVPMRDAAGKLHSLQVIDPEGGKRFQPGGRVKGCYHAIGKPNGLLIVCEGFATGASLHECTGHAVAVAFNAGNLQAVAEALASKHPALRLIVAADDDHQTEGNPGISKATQAARAVGGWLAVPVFAQPRAVKATDFNDLHHTGGAEAVRACIEAARQPAATAFAHGGDFNGFEPGSAWPDPVPLVASIEPEPYPLDALPPTMREAVQEVQAFAQAPVAMVATSALSALSLAAQGLHDVKRADKLTGPIGLFTLVVADSGERKTTCDEFFTPAIRKWERDQAEAMQPEVERFEADVSAWAAERDGVLSTIKDCAKKGKPTDQFRRVLAELQSCKPVAPRVPRLIYSDVTPEELGYRLATRWPSAAIASSEAGAVLGSHGMTGDSAMRNMARLNDLWSGQEIQSDRRTTESWVARGARLTVGLQVQESTLRAFFDKSAGLARGTGFLARFLVAWPPSTQGTRMFQDAPGQWPKLATYHQRIERILSVPLAMDDGALTPALMPLTAEAKAMWVSYHDEVEKRLSAGGEYADVRDVASKSADNAARLAALFQIFEQGGGGAIGAEAMEPGCLVAAWHLQESRRFFGEIAQPQETADALRVIQWVKDYSHAQGTVEIATRDLQRLGPVRNKDRLTLALKELQDAHHIRLHTEGKRKWVEIHPMLAGGAQS